MFVSSGSGIQGTKTDGTFWSWGGQYRGILGHGQADSVKISSPTQLPGTNWSNYVVTSTKSFATKTDGTLWEWGLNSKGRLGH